MHTEGFFQWGSMSFLGARDVSKGFLDFQSSLIGRLLSYGLKGKILHGTRVSIDEFRG